jgi:hypothetical protein
MVAKVTSVPNLQGLHYDNNHQGYLSSWIYTSMLLPKTPMLRNLSMSLYLYFYAIRNKVLRCTLIL